MAAYTASNAEIAPSLGRNLAACAGRVPCTATAIVPLEALFQIGIVGNVRGKNLDGDDAIETRVSGTVDLSHPARSKCGLNLVRADARANRESHFFSNAGQLTTSVIGWDASSSTSVFTRKRWPSGETS